MNILIASSIHKEAITRLQEKHDVITAFNAPEEKLKSLIKDRELLIFRSGVQINSAVMSSAPHLRFLIRAGSGLDNLDVNYASGHGIKLICIPEPGAKAVAELCFAFMLILSRQILTADKLLRKGRWAKNELKGYLLNGKVLGIVGAGNVGAKVGEMGVAWGMKVLGCVHQDEYTQQLKDNLSAKGIKLADFDEVVANADFLTIHVPLNNSTRNLIDEKVLDKMKPGSYLMNLSRGSVVNEQALYKALTEGGKLRGAGLDVHAEEGENKISTLASLPNVVLTPHIGAQTMDTQKEIGEKIVESTKLLENEIENSLILDS